MFLATRDRRLFGDESKGLGIGGGDIVATRNWRGVVRLGIKLLVKIMVIVISKRHAILTYGLSR